MPSDKPLTSITTIVDSFLEQAIEVNASDIHFIPSQKNVNIHFRIDGTMHEIDRQAISMHETILSRIKILGNLDISEKRLPQDGSFPLTHNDKNLDFRVSTFPTYYGECAVIRVLDHSKLLFDVDSLGMLPEQDALFHKIIRQPYGLILVSGPTGSGKTTTLFTAISQLNTDNKTIVTLEDPIEYQIEGLRQTQINPKIGLTFSLGLKSLFRQNPDIILVGEIRDSDTAHTAIQAGISGHLIFSTLHTHDTFSAIIRLIEMDVERFLVATALRGCISQRLVRTICSKCATPYEPPRVLLEDLGIEKESIDYIKGIGCESCGGTGYRGRTAIFEILPITLEISDLILRRVDYDTLKDAITGQNDFFSLKQSALVKLRKNMTTVEEVYRVLSLRD